ncbi:acetyltransferase (GNAT) family protein [Seonamhaeicola aphaedonensis]|uniref:Acetyltransferase (GNAT) family protein n=2 Tax=Seonamhaeicola aphaedonensis TaxID=1461338 RepID=A0A3D9HEN5_9FLAO|nr:acetyltransferase (GNAT) family protein [Seonamhaeicola aphaedonensis]
MWAGNYNTYTHYLMIIKTFDAFSRLSIIQINRVTRFIVGNYSNTRETKTAIRKSIMYATKELPGLGGFVFTVEHKNELLAAAVVNKTGMNEYLSENILVYLAVKEEYRKKGIANKLIQHIVTYCKGDISIYVQRDDVIMNMFKKFGFESRNVEMRLERKTK